MFLSHFIIIISKAYKDQNQVQPSPGHGFNFNNLVHNPAVLNDLQLLCVCTLFVTTASIPRIINDKPPDTADMIFLSWLPLRWMFFINPILFLYFNPAIRNHFKRDFWDWAPDWLQKYNPYLIEVPNP